MCHSFEIKSCPAVWQGPLTEVFMRVPCSVMIWKSTPTQYNTTYGVIGAVLKGQPNLRFLLIKP